MKRRLLIFAWALASFFSGLILAHFGLILIFSIYHLAGPSAEDGSFPVFLASLLAATSIVPFLFSAYAFHLGYQGRLPGTRSD